MINIRQRIKDFIKRITCQHRKMQYFTTPDSRSVVGECPDCGRIIRKKLKP